ncbi:MAG TPA: metal-sensitive transcriptional regulator [Ilumatobacter sp.]
MAVDAGTSGGAGGPGYHDDKAAVLARLRRIEGQIRGLQRLVDDDTYCIDVLTQVSAATRALQSVAMQLLDDHLHHCVASAVTSSDPAEADRIITEASRAIERLVKS